MRLSLRHDDGFSVIELLNVVLIVGILSTIAIPNLLNVRNKAYDTKAFTSLRNAAQATARVQRDAGKFPPTAEQTLQAIQDEERGLRFEDRTPSLVNQATGPMHVTVERAADNLVTICNKSESERYFCYRTDEDGLLLKGDPTTGKISASVSDAIKNVPPFSLVFTEDAQAYGNKDEGSPYVSRSTGATEWDARCVLRRRVEGYVPQDIDNDGVTDTYLTDNCGSGRLGWIGSPLNISITPAVTPEVEEPIELPPNPEGATEVVVCHFTGDTDPNNDIPDYHSIVINQEDLEGHLGHHDYIGACAETPDPVGTDPDLNPTPIPAPEPAPAEPSEPKKVVICHFTSSKKNPFVTLEVSRSAYDTHVSHHGDHLGPCTGDEVPPKAGSSSGTKGTLPPDPTATPTP